ncbi:hypothetical protein GCM10010116_33480 [Microbispora rosea subsp. aerata]|nr:(2Fe-2S)-binding protein [Microbispora rosea]GGO16611.1 hypothetical protein GCM10010116_33480 [Microbispora rosea subsp. aerata]GIH56040.1 hypothetical protein Mro02_29540 [Microbispora rosea subsp. aerata]GLJ86641.1 hypothetical protein GCM10017588_53790 [Microbispora rosea subsp. aerata]
MRSLDQVIADVSEIGGYFHLYTADAPPGPWLPLTRLLSDSDAFGERISAACDLLGTDERRVIASVLHLGIVARLWSPVLGAAVVHRVLLDWTVEELEWKDALGGPLPLRLSSPSGRPVADLSEAAEPLYRSVSALLKQLADLVLSQVKLAPRLLWGNAASALGGIIRALARERPEHAADALTLGNLLLDLEDLRGTGHFTEPAPGRPFFTRTSCCLYYRIPGGGKCGDCALLASDVRRAQWAQALKENL